MRNTIILSISQASAQSRLVNVNKPIERVNSRRVERERVSHAVSGMTMTSAVK